MTLKTIALFLFLSCSLFAQNAIHYNIDNGLPSNHIYRIAQSPDGFIWILTDRGISKFDGTTFRNFSTRDGLPVNDIWEMRFTPDGKLWFFTRTTRLGYIRNDSVFTFPFEDEGISMYPNTIIQHGNQVDFFNDNYYTLSQNEENPLKTKWTTDAASFKRWKNIIVKTKNSFSTPANSFYRGGIDDSLAICLSSSEYVLYYLKTGRIKRFKYADFDPALRQVPYPRFISANGEIQISGMGFVAKLTPGGAIGHIIKFPEEYNAHGGFLDVNGNLWLATMSDGVYFLPAATMNTRYLLTGKKISRFSMAGGKIFASAFNEGFFRFDKSGRFVPEIQSKAANYTVFAIDNHATAFLTNRAYFKKTPSGIYTFQRKNGFNPIFKVISFQNKWYGISTMGLFQIDPDNFSIQPITGLVGINDIINFRDRLLIATTTGIFEFDHDKCRLLDFSGKQLEMSVLKLLPHKDKLIICTDGFGAFATDLKSIEKLPQSGFLSIQSGASDNRRLWLATNNGILTYQAHKGNLSLLRKYTKNDGLPTNNILDILPLQDSLIIASNKGVCILPQQIPDYQPTLNIRIEDLLFNDKSVKNKHQFYYQPGNQLNIQIATTDFAIEKNPTFQYKLLPVLKNWKFSNYNNLNFNDLPPGEYRLELKKGKLQNAVSFRILPLWYQTSFAKTIFILIILAAVILLARWYNKHSMKLQAQKLSVKRKEIEQELYALRSQLNPHFVFNSLNSIQSFISNNESNLSEKYLVKFSRLIRMFFDLSRKRAVNLKNEIELLQNYLEIEKLRFGDKLNFSFDIDPQIALFDTTIPSMLLQPVLENAVNHGLFHKPGPGHVLIKFRKTDTASIKVEISDDGISNQDVQKILEQSLTNEKLSSGKILLEKIELLNQSGRWNVSLNIHKNQNAASGTTVIFEITNLTTNPKTSSTKLKTLLT